MRSTVGSSLRNHVDERWFLRTLIALCVLVSLALGVQHQLGCGLRTGRASEPLSATQVSAVPAAPPLIGTYTAPAVTRGQVVKCLYRDRDCRFTSTTDAPIPWPRVQPLDLRGGCGLLVNPALGNRAVLARRAVPCVIEDDLAVDTMEEQQNWSDYWHDVYERTEARRQARPDAFGQTHLNQLREIGRWRNDVAEMLAFVSNMVTERGYDALTADGFAAVRRMLDRPDRAG